MYIYIYLVSQNPLTAFAKRLPFEVWGTWKTLGKRYWKTLGKRFPVGPFQEVYMENAWKTLTGKRWKTLTGKRWENVDWKTLENAILANAWKTL